MQLIDFILCEDIRREERGKLSLMGIFGNEIKITIEKKEEGAIPLRLSILMRIFFEDGDLTPDEFHVQLNANDKKLAAFDGHIELDKLPTIMQFPLVANSIPIASDCQLTFDISFKNGGDILMDESLAYPVDVTIIEQQTV